MICWIHIGLLSLLGKETRVVPGGVPGGKDLRGTLEFWRERGEWSKVCCFVCCVRWIKRIYNITCNLFSSTPQRDGSSTRHPNFKGYKCNPEVQMTYSLRSQINDWIVSAVMKLTNVFPTIYADFHIFSWRSKMWSLLP